MATKYCFRKKHTDSTVEKKKSSKKKKSKRFLLINTILLSILLVGCFIGGIILGLMTSSFTPEINIIHNEDNVFKFFLKDNKVIIGGKLNIYLHMNSKTILSYNIKAHNIRYFYYPIGKSYTCLLYNGGLANSKTWIPFTRRSELGVPLNNDEKLFKTKFEFQIYYAFREEAETLISVPLYIGYEIKESQKSEVQPLYNDCKNFQRIYFSIQLSKIIVTSNFRSVNNSKVFDLVFHCACSIDNNLDFFFNGAPQYKNTILSRLKNNPLLIP